MVSTRRFASSSSKSSLDLKLPVDRNAEPPCSRRSTGTLPVKKCAGYPPRSDHSTAATNQVTAVSSPHKRPPREPKYVSSRRQSRRHSTIEAITSTSLTSQQAQTEIGATKHNDGQGTPPIGDMPGSIPKRQEKPSVRESHFLKGIDFDCHDLLSIPSPPSGKHNRLRRQSLSFLPSTRNKTGPFQDLTNEVGGSPFANSQKLSNHLKSATQTKKRQSLCHVPSPVEYDEHPKKKLRSPENQRQKQLQKSPQHLLDLDESFDDHEGCNIQKRNNRRSRRRQSILLPSECGVNLDQLVQDSGLSIAPLPMQQPSEGKFLSQNVTMTNVLDFPKDDNNQYPNFAEIQGLVRSYCHLPEDSQQARAEIADMIRSKTGYSLSRPVPTGSVHSNLKNDSGSNSEIVGTQRKELLLRLGPAMQLMEEQKVAQARQTELFTGCKVEKTRSGKYRYRNVDGKKIPSEEYKARYLQMINKNKTEKAKTFQVMRQELESSWGPNIDKGDCGHQQNLVRTTTTTATIVSGTNGALSSSDACIDNGGGDKETQEIPFDALVERDANCACMKDLDAGNRTKDKVSDDDGKGGGSAVVVACRDTITPCKTAAAADSGADGDMQIDSPKGLGEKSHNILLPLPSRDDGSDDPEVAQAESKLWLAIDTALQTYSREILEIQARRRKEVVALK